VFTSEDCVHAEFLLDSQKLVILGKAFASAGGSSLDLSGSEPNHKVSDEWIFGFSRAMGDHDSPAILQALFSSFNGLSQTAYLIDLEQ
jgi:hypothetical protein